MKKLILSILMIFMSFSGCSHSQLEYENLYEEERLALEDEEIKTEILVENKSEPKIIIETESKNRIENPLELMKITIDEMEGITWYKDKNTPKYIVNNIHLLIGKREAGKPWLRFRVQYKNPDKWLFINSFFFVADKKRFDTTYSDFNRDNGYTGIWEWYDESPSKQDIDMIKAIIASKKTTIRLRGKHYHKDRVISSEEKESLQNVLDAFVSLGGEI